MLSQSWRNEQILSPQVELSQRTPEDARDISSGAFFFLIFFFFLVFLAEPTDICDVM